MRRAQPNGKRQFVFAVLAISISMFSSTHVPAEEQGYLDSINAEAQNLGEVDNTEALPRNQTPVNNSFPDNDSISNSDNGQETFLQKIKSTLYSEPNGAEQDEAAYLKQLEKEVQKLNASPRQPATAPRESKAKREEAVNLQAEKDKLIQITEAQRKEMEINLETKLPGIYRLYKKLGLSQKNLVVKEYMESKKVSTASKTVLKLYGNY
jgi:hypothetical protein